MFGGDELFSVTIDFIYLNVEMLVAFLTCEMHVHEIEISEVDICA